MNKLNSFYLWRKIDCFLKDRYLYLTVRPNGNLCATDYYEQGLFEDVRALRFLWKTSVKLDI
jgi:hypothetical protein